jgi:hypothetical protein
MGDLGSRRQKPRFFLRTVMIVTTWVVGAAFAAHVPDDGAQRRAEELAPVAPPDHPMEMRPPSARPDSPSGSDPGSHSGSHPAEAPPLIDPPSPTPA